MGIKKSGKEVAFSSTRLLGFYTGKQVVLFNAKGEKEMKSKVFTLLVLSALLLVPLSACGSQPVETPEEAAPAEEVAAEEEAAPAEQAEACLSAEELDTRIAQYQGGYDRPEWNTSVTPEETIRINFLSYQNNPFWIQQKVGVEEAIQEAADLGLNAEIVFTNVSENLDPTLMVSAIEAAVVQEYDAIVLFPLNESVVEALNQASDAGIVIGHIATDAPNSPRTVVIGQDLLNAGKMAGYLMIQATGGTGKVGIITGQFGVTPHELRQQGFEEALAECPGMEVVGVVEAHDSADETYAAAQNFMVANPDLVGLYMTAGGPFGAGRAVEEAGKVGEIAVVGFDVTEQHIPYVRNGSMITIHQHEPWQSHDNIVFLYNLLAAGEEPSCTECYTPAEVVTQDNVDEWDVWSN